MPDDLGWNIMPTHIHTPIITNFHNKYSVSKGQWKKMEMKDFSCSNVHDLINYCTGVAIFSLLPIVLPHDKCIKNWNINA